MCDHQCVKCGNTLPGLRQVAMVLGMTGREGVTLCEGCGRPNQVGYEDNHLRIKPVDPDIYEALLHDPHYQQAQFERAMHPQG